MRRDNLPSAVRVHPDIGEAVVEVKGFPAGFAFFAICTGHHGGIAVHSTLRPDISVTSMWRVGSPLWAMYPDLLNVVPSSR